MLTFPNSQVKLGDDFAAAHGERLSQSDQQEAAKVPGCVSVVRIRVSLQEDSLGTGLEVRGDADARVARGMLALLAKGLRGAGLEEVMALDARQLIRTAKLDQFLPPGRNDGLSSMLAVIKQEAAALPSDDTASVLQAQAGSPQGSAGQSDDGKARAGQDSSMVEAEDVSASNAVSQVWAFGGRAEEVAMLLSGGVDSSVAMALLKDQGYKVTAFYLKIWLEDELAHLGECPWEDDWHYASSVARDLSIPLEAVSLQREYWDQVVKYLIDESARGRTPNPDIMCNSRIKFGMFHDYVGKHFSAIASGHYARQQVCEQTGRAQLCMSPDAVKDQTYFLCNMNQDQVSHARFPLGALQKSQVRELAHKYSLATESRKDSQGICFLGKLKFEDFVGHHLGENPGPVHEFGSNRLIGEHRGLWFYTIGQRKGLGGATRQFTHEGPWFVAGKNVDSNTLLVTNQYHLIEAPRRAFEVEDINWIAGAPPEMQGGALDLRVKTRHGPNMHDCVLEVSGEARRQGHVKLAGRDSGLAPGQWAAFYRGEECLGGGGIGESSFTPRREEGRHEPDVGGPLGASEAAAQGADRLAHEVLFMEDS
jgi:tRNA (5-methylaminomethyl-2-thiouridylate)-methyltransferase